MTRRAIKSRDAVVGRLYTSSPRDTVPSVCVFVNHRGHATMCISVSPFWMTTHVGSAGHDVDLYEWPVADDPAVARVMAHLYQCAREPGFSERLVRAHMAEVERRRVKARPAVVAAITAAIAQVPGVLARQEGAAHV